MLKFIKAAVVGSLIACSGASFAGADVYGTISSVQVRADGTLSFSFVSFSTSPQIALYCGVQGFGQNVLVPASSPIFPYYYGIVMAAYVKQKSVVLPNIDNAGGTTNGNPCDVTKTGYGIITQN